MIHRQTRAADEVIVVDNASQDGTGDLVEAHYPAVVVHRNAKNSGCSGGRNDQIRRSTHQYVMIVDDDAFLDPGCLEALESAVATRPDASIWAPRICYEQDRERIQFDGGGDIHFVCEAVLRNPDRLVVECPPENVGNRELGFQGGVAFLLDKVAALEVDGYDESFFFGRTDGEFSFRLTLLKKSIVHVPGALVFHRVKLRGLAQVERQIRNRWAMMLHTFSASTLIVIFPALLMYEVALAIFLTAKGDIRAYVGAWRQLWTRLPTIWKKRKGFVARKAALDRDVLVSGAINMRADLKSNRTIHFGLAAMNYFFNAYWRIAGLLLRLFQHEGRKLGR